MHRVEEVLVVDDPHQYADDWITFARSSPKSSSFCCRGVLFSSLAASVTAAWMMPISVDTPVRTTMPMHPPLETVVEANSMLVLPWMSMVSTASNSLDTLCDPPVSCDCSMRMVVVSNFTMRIAAGNLAPTFT